MESDSANSVIISDEDRLLRRIQFTNPDFIKPDGTPASSSFSLKRNEDGLSVDLEKLTSHEIAIKSREKYRLFVLDASFTSSLGLLNEHNPKPDNYAHALIKGNITRSIARKLAMAAVRVL
jgi:hypothetical protein